MYLWAIFPTLGICWQFRATVTSFGQLLVTQLNLTYQQLQCLLLGEGIGVNDSVVRVMATFLLIVGGDDDIDDGDLCREIQMDV